ncbi:MAG: glucose-6-phosphate dehydrogenase, partial [Patescibacteria group bacterium]
PFGTNLRTAKRLQKILLKHFDEKQIFLLDHYLGKEAVSNLLSLRLANPILNTLLDRKNVANIQIHAMENVDIEGRANYFDHVGIARDMVQSHLLQILSYLTMNLPTQKTAEAIRKEKIKILKSAQIKSVPDEVIRGQYQGYRKEKGIAPDSQAETFVALKLRLKHPAWKNVPIYFRTGKALKDKWTAVVIEFKSQDIQERYGIKEVNRLVIQLQPTEKIEFHLLTKLGGKTFDFHELTTGRPIYCSGDCISEHGRLLLDVIDNKKGLFLSFEEILAAWKVIDPIEKLCSKMRSKCTLLHVYPRGSLGPKAAEHLIEKEGFKWFYSLPKK